MTIAPLPLRHGPGAVAHVFDAIAKVDPRRYRGWNDDIASVLDLWRDQRYARSVRQLPRREIHRRLGQ